MNGFRREDRNLSMGEGVSDPRPWEVSRERGCPPSRLSFFFSFSELN